MKSYTKHPYAVSEIEFDFRDALTKLSDTASWHQLLSDTGIAITSTSDVPGVYKVLVGGGESGKQYNFGVQLMTDQGPEYVDIRRMRVRGLLLPDVPGGEDGFLDGGNSGDPDGGFMDGGS